MASISAPVALSAGSQSSNSKALNTYFIQAQKPLVTLSPAGSPRQGTTRLTVQLREQDVNGFMPVITAQKDGLVHNVVNTWQFLKVTTADAAARVTECSLVVALAALVQCLRK